MAFKMNFDDISQIISSAFNDETISRHQTQQQIKNGFVWSECAGVSIINEMNKKFGYTNNELNMIDVSAKEVLVLLNNKSLFKTKKLFWGIEPSTSFFIELENAMLLHKLDILFEGEPK